MTASRREAGQENFRDRARQSRGAGAQRDACFPPFSWPVRQCEHVCAAYPPPAHTLSQSLLLCCADRGRASLWGLLSFRGLVPDQHGGKRGGRQVGMVLSVHIRFAHRRQSGPGLVPESREERMTLSFPLQKLSGSQLFFFVKIYFLGMSILPAYASCVPDTPEVRRALDPPSYRLLIATTWTLGMAPWQSSRFSLPLSVSPAPMVSSCVSCPPQISRPR